MNKFAYHFFLLRPWQKALLIISLLWMGVIAAYVPANDFPTVDKEFEQAREAKFQEKIQRQTLINQQAKECKKNLGIPQLYNECIARTGSLTIENQRQYYEDANALEAEVAFGWLRKNAVEKQLVMLAVALLIFAVPVVILFLLGLMFDWLSSKSLIARQTQGHSDGFQLTWKHILAALFISTFLELGVGLFLGNHVLLSYRHDIIFFTIEEGLLFIASASVLLLILSAFKPMLRIVIISQRLIGALIALTVFSIAVYGSKRELAEIVLLCMCILMVVWVLVGEYKKQIFVSAFLLVMLLLVPFDVVITSPLRSSHGNEATVEILEARYGLSVNYIEGTYGMGCVVPPNPVKWILFVNIWPHMDRIFQKYDPLFKNA